MPDQQSKAKNVLVLGAYGFIGAAVVRALRRDGCHVIGMVRHLETGHKVLPGVDLIRGDLRHMLSIQDWQTALTGVDVVVNCAGALQDGREDDLEAVHHTAIAALAEASALMGKAVVQISAIGAEDDASTAFMRTKSAGDAALRDSGVPLWIFKPGLVIGQSDYGGTALLRLLAAVPWVQPIAYPDTPIQSVGMRDVCHAVLDAVHNKIPPGSYDLVEDTPRPLSQVLSATRHWLGFPAARLTMRVPVVLTTAIAKCADLLGRFGWRSPLRSTAMTVMADGVTGDPTAYRAASGRSLPSLDQIYDGLAAAREHRLAARMALLMPIVIAALCLFWVLSGVLGLTGLSQAAQVLTGAGWPFWFAAVSVIFWSLVDIALGLAVLWRPWAARVCLAQAGVAMLYLIAASFVTPALWADPLGPLVKIIPAVMLSLVARAMLESR